MFPLESMPLPNSVPDSVIYLMRPDVKLVGWVAEQIKCDCYPQLSALNIIPAARPGCFMDHLLSISLLCCLKNRGELLLIYAIPSLLTSSQSA